MRKDTSAGDNVETTSDSPDSDEESNSPPPTKDEQSCDNEEPSAFLPYFPSRANNEAHGFHNCPGPTPSLGEGSQRRQLP